MAAAAAAQPVPLIGSRYQFGPHRIGTVVAIAKDKQKRYLVKLKFDDDQLQEYGFKGWMNAQFLGPEVNASIPPGATEGGRRRLRKKTRQTKKSKRANRKSRRI